LPNQLDPSLPPTAFIQHNSQLYRDLMHRSVSDLSVNLTQDDGVIMHNKVMEIHKEHVQVVEVLARRMEHKIIMIIVLSNGRVMIYQNM
jgi:hypothetical protein